MICWRRRSPTAKPSCTSSARDMGRNPIQRSFQPAQSAARTHIWNTTWPASWRNPPRFGCWRWCPWCWRCCRWRHRPPANCHPPRHRHRRACRGPCPCRRSRSRSPLPVPGRSGRCPASRSVRSTRTSGDAPARPCRCPASPSGSPAAQRLALRRRPRATLTVFWHMHAYANCRARHE